MQRLSLGFYANRATGELMSRVVDDVNHVERVLLDGTEQLIVALLTLVGVAGILFYLNPMLAARRAHTYSAVGLAGALVHQADAQTL